MNVLAGGHALFSRLCQFTCLKIGFPGASSANRTILANYSVSENGRIGSDCNVTLRLANASRIGYG